MCLSNDAGSISLANPARIYRERLCVFAWFQRSCRAIYGALVEEDCSRVGATACMLRDVMRSDVFCKLLSYLKGTGWFTDTQSPKQEGSEMKWVNDIRTHTHTTCFFSGLIL